jgi:hypothetical protein
LPILILFFLVLVFFGRTLFLGEMFVTPNLGVGEITIGSMPLRFYLAQELKAGRLPLWTERLYAGYPLLAETTIAAFYPPNLVFFTLLPAVLGFHVNFAFAFFLAGIFTYLFCRLIKLSRGASLLSAIAFTFSGYWVTHITHNIVIDTIAWFPVEIYLLERFVRASKRSSILLLSLVLGVVVAVQFLAGHAQFFVYSLFFAGVYFLFRLWSGALRQRQVGFGLVSMALSAIVALGLSAIQILPSLEYFRLSERAGGLSSEIINEHPFHFKELVTFVFPNYNGTPVNFTHNPPFQDKGIYWEMTAYVGLLTLLLAGASLLRIRSGIQVFLYVLLLFSLIMAMGGIGPLSSLLTIPPFGYFRIPSRFLYFTTFALAILAGFGLDHLIGRLISTHRPTSSGKLFVIHLAAISLVVADLFRFGYRYNPVYPAQEWLEKPRTVEILQEDTGFFRIFDIGLSSVNEENVYLKARKKERGWSGDLHTYRHLLNWLMPKTNLFYEIDHAGGVMALSLELVKRVDSLVRTSALTGEVGEERLNPTARKLFNLLGVKYFISAVELFDDTVSLVGNTDGTQEPVFRVYENPAVLPEAFIVAEARSFSDREAVFAELLREEFDPLAQVLLEGEEGLLTEDFAGSGSSDREVIGVMRNENQQEVMVTAKASEPGWLVLTDTFYPGWNAYVDGAKTTILRADYLFRAVPVPAGEHNVVFRYEPESFWWGVRITLATAAVTLVGILLLAIKGRKNA